jgi:hypothetical protein
MFPSLQSSAASASASAAAGGGSGNVSLNYARAVSVQPPANSYGMFDSALSRAPQLSSMSTPSVSRPLYRRGSLKASQWVSTGSSVTAQYLEFREQAYQLACARNKCFMKATQAYRKYVQAV